MKFKGKRNNRIGRETVSIQLPSDDKNIPYNLQFRLMYRYYPWTVPVERLCCKLKYQTDLIVSYILY